MPSITELPLEVFLKITSFMDSRDVVSLLDVFGKFMDKLCCLVFDNEERRDFRFQFISKKVSIRDFDPSDFHYIYIFELDYWRDVDQRLFTGDFEHRNKIIVFHYVPKIEERKSPQKPGTLHNILRSYKSKNSLFLLEGFKEIHVDEDLISPEGIMFENIGGIYFKSKADNSQSAETIEANCPSIYRQHRTGDLGVYVGLSADATLRQFNFEGDDGQCPESLAITAGILSKQSRGLRYYDITGPIISLSDCNWTQLVSLKIETYPKMILQNINLPKLKTLKLKVVKGAKIEKLNAENVTKFELSLEGNSFQPFLNNTIKIGNSKQRCLTDIKHHSFRPTEDGKGSLFEADYDQSLFLNSSRLFFNNAYFLNALESKHEFNVFANIELMIVDFCYDDWISEVSKLSHFHLKKLKTLKIIITSFVESKLSLQLKAENLTDLSISCFSLGDIDRAESFLTVDLQGSTLQNLKSLRLNFLKIERFRDLDLPSLEKLELHNVLDSTPSVDSKYVFNMNMVLPKIKQLVLRNYKQELSDVTVIVNQKLLESLPAPKPKRPRYDKVNFVVVTDDC